MRRFGIILVLLFICAAVRADDSAVQGLGGAVAPMKQHPSVRMVRERVDVKLGWEGAMVRCRFVFRNESKAAIVRMGFPEHAGGDVGPITRSVYKRFRSWVDGRRVKTRFMPSGPESRTQSYTAWHVKDVSFKAGQTRIIEDEYDSPYGGNSMGDMSFAYILASGRNWKGPIGEAVITIDASEVWSYWCPEPSKEYPGFVRKGKSITWTLKNLEPEKDIDVGLRQRWMLYLDDPRNGTRLHIDDPELFGRHGIAMVSANYLRQLGKPVLVGGKVSQGVKLSNSRHSLLIRLGSKTAILDGESRMTLPREPYMNEYHELSVPVLTVAKALGAQIVVDKRAGTITIKEPMKR